MDIGHGGDRVALLSTVHISVGIIYVPSRLWTLFTETKPHQSSGLYQQDFNGSTFLECGVTQKYETSVYNN